jgi:signal peptidase II
VPSLGKRLALVAGVALAAAFADQATKRLALWLLAEGPAEIIPGLFDLRLVFNRGAAFGILAGEAWAPAALIGVTVLALAVAAWLAVGHPGQGVGGRVSLGLIAGGAVGNLIDRLTRGAVIDFLDLHLGPYHWPTFNLADAAITVGAAGLGWLLLRGKA